MYVFKYITLVACVHVVLLSYQEMDREERGLKALDLADNIGRALMECEMEKKEVVEVIQIRIVIQSNVI